MIASRLKIGSIKKKNKNKQTKNKQTNNILLHIFTKVVEPIFQSAEWILRHMALERTLTARIIDRQREKEGRNVRGGRKSERYHGGY